MTDQVPSKERIAELIADYQLRYEQRDCKCETSDELSCKCCRRVCVCHFDFDTIVALKEIQRLREDCSAPEPAAEPSAWLSCSKCDAKVELQVIDGYAQLTEAAMAWTCDTKNGWRCPSCSAQPPEDAQHAGGRIMTLRECMDAEDGGE
jgi:hypothetical protein